MKDDTTERTLSTARDGKGIRRQVETTFQIEAELVLAVDRRGDGSVRLSISRGGSLIPAGFDLSAEEARHVAALLVGAPAPFSPDWWRRNAPPPPSPEPAPASRAKARRRR